MDFERNTPVSKVKKAFRNASLKYHPDKNKSPEAREIYNSLNDNIEILKDTDKKEIYDYYKVKSFDKIAKPTAMTGTEEDYKTQIFLQKLSFCWA